LYVSYSNSKTSSLCQAFAVHGEIEEGAVIYDKATGKSRGYGFITYKSMESAQNALKAPSKLIDVSEPFLLLVLFSFLVDFPSVGFRFLKKYCLNCDHQGICLRNFPKRERDAFKYQDIIFLFGKR